VFENVRFKTLCESIGMHHNFSSPRTAQ